MVRALTESPESRPAGTIAVLVVDDHPLVREGTRRLLEGQRDITVVGEAESGEGALELAAKLGPDVVLLDIHLGGLNGFDVARKLSDEHPNVKILMLTAFDDREYVHAALAAGASGYLLKTTRGEELAEAIRGVLKGREIIDPVLEREISGQDAKVDALALTDREMEVVALLAEGLPNKAIASRLGISRRTVEGHISRVFAKVGATSRTELLRFALSHHLVTLKEDR